VKPLLRGRWFHVPPKAHVPEADLHALQVTLQHGVQPRIVLHPVGESVAIDRYNIVLLNPNGSAQVSCLYSQDGRQDRKNNRES